MSAVPTILVTKRTRSGRAFRGGVPPYQRVRAEILRLLGDRSALVVTTMIDYYALPHSFPGNQAPLGIDIYQRVACLETAWQQDIHDQRFLPYYAVHEFEALLFSSPSAVATALGNASIASKLVRDRSAFRSPEEIDDDPHKHPSALLVRYYPPYKKLVDGARIATNIGINLMRRECKHFDEWARKLETC